VARTALKVLIEEKMIENAAEVGRYFLEALQQIKSPLVKEVRGRGLMIGLELFPRPAEPARTANGDVTWVLCKDTHDNIIRFTPPLIIKKEEVDWAMEKITSVFANA